MPERALLAHGRLVLPLSVAPRLLGSCPMAVTPGLAPLMVRVHILHKTNQALNNCKCCQFLEQTLKPGCVFCVSNHNTDFGLVSLNFGQALDAVWCWEQQGAPARHFWVPGGHECLAAPWSVTASFSVSVFGLDLLPSLLCPVWKFQYSSTDKNAELCSYLLSDNSFLLSPFPSTADLWLLSPAIYFLSPSSSGRTSRRKWGQ